METNDEPQNLSITPNTENHTKESPENHDTFFTSHQKNNVSSHEDSMEENILNIQLSQNSINNIHKEGIYNNKNNIKKRKSELKNYIEIPCDVNNIKNIYKKTEKKLNLESITCKINI